MSLLSIQTWQKICHQKGNVHLSLDPAPHGIVLTSLTGPIKCWGVANIVLFGKEISLYVVDNLKGYNLILGDDCLRILSAQIDYASSTVVLGSRRLKAHDIPQSEVYDLASVTTNLDYWSSKFPKLFCSDPDNLPATTSTFRCSIDTGDADPIYQRPYRLPLSKKHIVDKEIDKMLKLGIIQPSHSPWASPIVLVPKPDGETRFCIDYRKVNGVTRSDKFPLPQISEILDQLGGCKVFSTLDLRSGYHQLLLDRDAIPKTAFNCHRGLFEYKRLPFGLKNAPAQFQRFMTQALSKYIGKICMVYLDDIIVYSRDEESHQKHLSLIFSALQKLGMTLKLSKCNIACSEVKLLGFIVGSDGIRSCPEKVSCIERLLPPVNQKGVRSFLGLCNYYRSLVPNYAEKAAPLNRLLCKDVPFHFGPKEMASFQALKEELVSDRILAYPQPDKPYKIFSDACDTSIGAILVQDHVVNGEVIERPVSYFSKALSGPQLNWATIEKECFALISAIKKWQHYVQGAQVTAYTDHKPLKSFFISEHKNTKVQRWSILLSEIQCEIKYREGRNNIKADSLSRLKVTPESGDESDLPFDLDRNCLEISYLCTQSPEEIPTGNNPYEPLDPLSVLDYESNELDKIHLQVAFGERQGFEQEGWNMGEPEILFEFSDEEIQQIKEDQESLPEYKWGKENIEDYLLINGILFTIRTPAGHDTFPRVVLPPRFRKKVIKRAHIEVGHQGLRKTVNRMGRGMSSS